MMILISCAKTMTDKATYNVPFSTTPMFKENAIREAIELSEKSTEELANLLHVNTDIALKTHMRFKDFLSEEPSPIPALFAYNGAVYKNIAPRTFTEADLLYSQDHLLITSFLYGLLRPLDAIKSYRLEGNVRLAENGGLSMFDFWKGELTDLFINLVNKSGGTIVYLASEEMKDLFDWKKVEKSVNIIYPEFQVMIKDKLKTIVIYTKMCRGQMTRFILENRIEDVEMLKSFSWEGFTFNQERSTENKFSFIFF